MRGFITQAAVVILVAPLSALPASAAPFFSAPA
jgi:hypothetical protein